MAEAASLVLSVDVQRLGLRMTVQAVGDGSSSAGMVLARTASAFVLALDAAEDAQGAQGERANLHRLGDEVAKIRSLLERESELRRAIALPIDRTAAPAR